MRNLGASLLVLAFLLAYLLGGFTMWEAARIDEGNTKLLAFSAEDRTQWELAVSYLDAESTNNPDKRKREEAAMMVKLARVGHDLGFNAGVNICH